MPLFVITVELADGARWRVRSALPTRPVAGDRISYAGRVELDVARVVLSIGTGADVEVITGPTLELAATVGAAELEERLMALRFRRETLDPDPELAAPQTGP